jgi:hypothetical protein
MEDHLPFSLDKESLKGALHQSKSGPGERQYQEQSKTWQFVGTS